MPRHLEPACGHGAGLQIQAPQTRKTAASVTAILLLLLMVLALPAGAADSPVGRWRSIDDATGQAKAVIEIAEGRDGTLSAKIVRLIDTSDGPNPLCEQCKGKRHNQPILGMTIAWGLRPDGDTRWGGGTILDPENGKEYSVRMTPTDGGRRLEVRGFLGFALLGRTQVWQRE